MKFHTRGQGTLSTVLIGGQIEYRSAEWENWVPFWWVGKLNTVLLSGQIEYRSDVWANWVPFWWVGKLSTVLLSWQIEYRSDGSANWVPFFEEIEYHFDGWANWVLFLYAIFAEKSITNLLRAKIEYHFCGRINCCFSVQMDYLFDESKLRTMWIHMDGWANWVPYF